MILLNSPTDQVQIVTNQATSVDVHASWVDLNPSTGAITPGRKNITIPTATTTNVTDSTPLAAGASRNVKTLHIRNNHASLAQTITIQLLDGTGTWPIYIATLSPGYMIQVTDMGGIQIGRT